MPEPAMMIAPPCRRLIALLLHAFADVQVRQLEWLDASAPDARRFGVEQFRVAVVDTHHLGCHRAVEEDPPRRKLPGIEVRGAPVQQFLAASNRERGDDHVAAVGLRLREDRAELGHRCLALLVVAVAVGRFHQDQVGSRWR